MVQTGTKCYTIYTHNYCIETNCIVRIVSACEQGREMEAARQRLRF